MGSSNNNSAYHRKRIDGLSVNHVAEYCFYICLPGKIVASPAVRSHS